MIVGAALLVTLWRKGMSNQPLLDLSERMNRGIGFLKSRVELTF